MAASLQKHIDDFWKYAKTCGKCADLEDIYIEWANNKNLTLDEFKSAYVTIYSSIDSLLHSNKTALKMDMDPEEFRSLFSGNSTPPQPQNIEPAMETPVEDFQELTEPLEEETFSEDTGGEESFDEPVEETFEEAPQDVAEESSFDAFDNEEAVTETPSEEVSNEEIPTPESSEGSKPEPTEPASKRLGDSTLLDILGA